MTEAAAATASAVDGSSAVSTSVPKLAKKRSSIILAVSETQAASAEMVLADVDDAMDQVLDEKSEEESTTTTAAAATEAVTADVALIKGLAGKRTDCDDSDPLNDFELDKLKTMMCLALGLDRSAEWTSSSTSDPLLTIHYTTQEGSSITTVRGSTVCAGFDPYDFHRFTEDGPSEEIKWYFDNDDMCQEQTIIKRYSRDRVLIHARYSAGVSAYIISYRDLVYVRRRVYYEDIVIDTLPDGSPVREPVKLAQLAIGLVYSLPEDHPDQHPCEYGHVRGSTEFAGYIFFKRNREDRDCCLINMAKIDPKGSIPTWVINLAAPGQGMVAATTRDALPTLMDLLNKREKSSTSAAAAK